MRRAIVLALMILSCHGAAIAQPGNNEDPDASVPLTGLEYLLLAGGALGVRKIIQMRKKS